MFLSESPKEAIINDVNQEIMSIYFAVRDHPSEFISSTLKYVDEYFAQPDRKAYYYSLRERYWQSQSPELLYILMKLGFNGIWQTCKASNGLFGTPAGLLNHSKPEQIVNQKNIMEWSVRLQGAQITSRDFLDVNVPAGSFVYLDPPYRGSFTTYGTVFDDKTQQSVVDYAKAAAKHSTVWLANRAVEGDDFFEELLPDSKFYYFDVTYTAGRRKVVDNGFEALKAREFLCVV